MKLLYSILTFITLIVALFFITLAVYMTAFCFVVGDYFAQKIKVAQRRLNAREHIPKENHTST